MQGQIEPNIGKLRNFEKKTQNFNLCGGNILWSSLISYYIVSPVGCQSVPKIQTVET